MRNGKVRWEASVALLALIATPGIALAQDAKTSDADNQLSDIVVTAQRRTEASQSVPISMTVLNTASLSKLQNSNDLGNVVPNVQIEQTSGMGVPRIGIRGIAQNDGNASATTSNMVYIDDVPLNATVAQGVLIWDLERAEVLRGPQGTLFGRNATGGAIRYITKMPGKEWSGYGDVTLGRFGQNEVHAAVGGPVTDTLGVRLSYVGNHTDGDVYNVTLNQKQNKKSYYGVRGILDWKPNDMLSVVLRGQYFKSDIQPMVWKSTPGPVTGDAFGPLPDGRTVAQLMASYGYQNLGPATKYTQIQSDITPFEHLQHIPVSANIDLDLGAATLTSVTGYVHIRHRFAIDNDSSPLPILNEYDKSRDRQFTQEIRLASNNDGAFKWIVGGFYMRETINYDVYFDATEWRGNVFFPSARTVLYTRGIDARTESWAGFAHSTYDLTSDLTLTAAARYTWEKKDPHYRFRRQYEFATTVPRTSFQFPDFLKAVDSGNLGTLLAVASPATADTSKSWTNLSWKLSLDYKPSNHLLVYGLISRGFKGGAFAPVSNDRSLIVDANGAIISVPPETVTDFEAGFKADVIPGRLRINGSAYYYDYKNYQTNQFVAAVQAQVLSSLPKGRLFGAELEVQAIPFDGLHVDIGAGFANTKITKVNDPSDPGNAALLGNKFPLAESVNANVSVRYDIKTDIGTFSPEISGKYHGKYYTLKENDVQLGDYATLDARIGYESVNGTFYGGLWIKNLTNKRVPITIDDSSEFFGGNIAAVNARKTFGATLGARF